MLSLDLLHIFLIPIQISSYLWNVPLLITNDVRGKPTHTSTSMASVNILLTKASVSMMRSDINKAGKYVSLVMGENCKITCVLLPQESEELGPTI